jgi:hypothetical protein
VENKRWSFKVPGDESGRTKDIDISEIKSVYDLLDLMRKDEVQPAEQPVAQRKMKQPAAVLVPFISRVMDKRRHPSA